MMAETLRSTPKPPQIPDKRTSRLSGFFNWSRPAFALATLGSLVVVGWLGVRALHPSAARLLAQAYTERRTLEVRIPGAKYAPLRVERRVGGSNIDKPEPLLKAEELISENLRKRPNDPTWLQAKARADLLDGNYDSAINTLQRALETEPDDPQLLTDLGSAYYLRAQSADRSVDYGNAVEALGKALAKAPDDPITLFNRALASERLFLYTQAVDDWEHYLRVDPQGAWADEARKRLMEIKEKVKTHAESLAEPLLSTTEFVRTLAPGDAGGLSAVDQRVEDYLDRAIQEWLPAAFPVNEDRPGNLTAQNLIALKLLAGVLTSRHQDRWLADLLETSGSSDFSTGIHHLVRAVAANAEGDPDSALTEARQAEEFLQNSRSGPGKIRAEVEMIYAMHRQYHLQQCLAEVSEVERDPAVSNYKWVATQLELETYACASAGPEWGRRQLAAARKDARDANYQTLYLRALGFSASSASGSGEIERAWSWDRNGLEKYWSGTYPPLRAQHFYDDLRIIAQDSDQWFLAVALGGEAVAAIAATPNRTGEGMERIELAHSASEAHLWQESNREYSEALVAFSSLPQNDSIRAFRATAEIGLADVALNQKRVQDAEGHIRYAHENMPSSFAEPETWLALYRAMAKARMINGDNDGSQRACAAAVAVAEIILRDVHTELDRLRWSRISSECYRDLVKAKLTEHDVALALELWEWYRSAGVRLPQANMSPATGLANLDKSFILPTPYEVSARMSSLDRETVITYAELGEHVSAWVYDNRGAYWQPLEVASATLNSQGAEFATQCADPRSNLGMLRLSGRRLYDLLVAPLLARLDPSRTLVIEVDEDLSRIPFVSLVEPNGKYLVDRFQIVYLPSIGYRQLLREKSPVSRGDAALVVGPPAISLQDQPLYRALPDAEAEANDVASEFSHPSLVSGKKATFTIVSNGLLDAAVFHFAGHTRSQPGHTELLLAPESDAADATSTVLSTDGIDSLRFPRLKLAVLSACATDQDATNRGDVPDSLARAFLRGGVPSVIATRWAVDSTATAAAMRLFYRNTMSGMETPTALAEVMRQVSESPQYAHPYYWAAFNAFGRGTSSRSAQ
jgi:CHAT domain-containing protein